MNRQGSATGGNEDAPRVWAEVDEIVRLREQVKLLVAELARLREAAIEVVTSLDGRPNITPVPGLAKLRLAAEGRSDEG